MATRYRRNIFTGLLEEVESEGGGRRIIYRGSVPKHYDPTPIFRGGNYDRISKPLSLKPEDATPARIEAENEAARKHGTGCWFDNNGECHTVTRGSQNREMRRQGKANNDAGYLDYAGS